MSPTKNHLYENIAVLVRVYVCVVIHRPRVQHEVYMRVCICTLQLRKDQRRSHANFFLSIILYASNYAMDTQ